MSVSIYMNNELENEMTLDMSYFWYSDACGTYSTRHVVPSLKTIGSVYWWPSL